MEIKDSILDQKEVIKLEKNSKGYNWEIKVLGDPLINDAIIMRLKTLDEAMHNDYDPQ